MNSLIGGGQGTFGGSHLPAATPRLSAEDREALERAMHDLERSSLAIKLCSALGRQAVAIAPLVPPQLAEAATRAAEAAIRSSLALALRSLSGKPLRDRRRMHMSLATLAGAAGGAFGLSTFALELPFSTTIMLRAIADVARGEGHDLSHPHAALACLEVFALGGQINRERGAEFLTPGGRGTERSEGVALGTGYFALRAVLAKSLSEAASYLGGRGIAREAAPALIRFAAQIASHFGFAVSQKLVAQAMPLIGAAGGAAINYAFADHYQTVARGHFTVLRLERLYGEQTVRTEYERMRGQYGAML